MEEELESGNGAMATAAVEHRRRHSCNVSGLEVVRGVANLHEFDFTPQTSVDMSVEQYSESQLATFDSHLSIPYSVKRGGMVSSH